MEPQSEGHRLARTQINKHGRDRYPTAWKQWRKVLYELGGLGEAIGDDRNSDLSPDEIRMRIIWEYADVGLALYELGNKLDIDLIEAMAALVNADKRNFSEVQHLDPG